MAQRTVGERIMAVRALQRVAGREKRAVDVARKLGMDASQYRKYERGELEPRNETLIRIATEGLELPPATIADPELFTVAMLELAMQEWIADAKKRRLSRDHLESGVQAFEWQLREKRSHR